MTDLTGQQFGNYCLVALLGEGSFAQVYLGEHIYLKSKAALKIVHTRLQSEEQEHFLAEARLLVKLKHPHIIRVLDFGLQDNIPFLVMDYAPNGTLRQRHPKGTILPLETIMNYVQQIADALQFAHNENLIHRDIKPENMLLGQHNEVVLSDFGVAMLSQNTLSYTMQDFAGTPAYMAPEQIQGKPRQASDQYALGIVVYEWLSGKRPFDGPFVDLISQQMFEPPPLLQGRVTGITFEIESVVLTALSKDYKKRFASISAFSLALQQSFQLHQNIDSNKSSPPRFLPSSAFIRSSPAFSSQIMVGDTSKEHQSTHRDSVPQLIQDSSLLSSPTKDSKVSFEESQRLAGLVAVPSNTSLQTESLENIQLSSHSTKKGISRRTIVEGLAGAGAIGLLGGSFLLWHTLTRQPIDAHAVFDKDAMFGFNPQHTHYEPDEHILVSTNVSRLVLMWIASTGTIGLSSPVVANGIVYIGSLDHNLYAINASTGKILWTITTGDQIYASAAISKGIVYFSSMDRNLYAANASTGAIIWKVALGSAIFPSPVISNGVIYIGTYDHQLYAINATTGKLQWTTFTNGGIESTATVANNVVYVGSKDHNLYAIEATAGKILWKAPTENEIFSSPAVANGIVYVGSKDYKFYAFHAVTGKMLWQWKTGHFVNSSPAIGRGIVYIGSKDSNLYALNATTGKHIWTFTSKSEIASSPTIASDILYVGSWDHNFYVLDAITGVVLWKTSTGEGIESSPLVSNGVVYFGSRDGHLYAFHCQYLPA